MYKNNTSYSSSKVAEYKTIKGFRVRLGNVRKEEHLFYDSYEFYENNQ